jgi:hypothetical protein
MNNIEQAYLDGFFKRAASSGLTLEEAADLFEKAAAPYGAKSQAVTTKPAPKTVVPTQSSTVAPKPVAPTQSTTVAPKPVVGEADRNNRAASRGTYVPKPLPDPKTIPLEY